MVRTKASNAAPAATRKGETRRKALFIDILLHSSPTAVAARAPRKTVGIPRPASSPSGGGGRSRKGKSVAGGNPAKLWPTPEWQTGIGVSPCLSNQFRSSPLSVQGFLQGSDGQGDQEEPGPSREAATHHHHQEDEEMMEEGSSSAAGGSGVGVALLDSSIAQLNSDDEDGD